MKKYQKAVEIFEKIIDEKPVLTRLAKAYNSCGIAYAELGKYDKAVEDFEEMIILISLLFNLSHAESKIQK